MTTYQLRIERLDSSSPTLAALVLRSAPDGRELKVRLCPGDAQTVALVLAGVGTTHARMASGVLRMAHLLDATPREVLLVRGAGNLIEAHLMIERGFERLALPLAFADAVAVVLAGKLPLFGDAALAPLFASLPDDEEVVLSPAISAFLQSL